MYIKQELLKLLERRVFNAEELVEEIDKLYKQYQALQLQQTGVSGSILILIDGNEGDSAYIIKDDEELKRWEKDGSIEKGDRLYKAVFLKSF